jgi:hypothetical protein
VPPDAKPCIPRSLTVRSAAIPELFAPVSVGSLKVVSPWSEVPFQDRATASCPPATQFVGPVDRALWQEKVEASNAENRDLSLYFHLPFCRSLCWYCGCTTVITTQQNQSATYLSYLAKELALTARHINPARKVTQLHFGGGTPVSLPEKSGDWKAHPLAFPVRARR